MVRGRHGSDGWMHAYGLTEDGFIGFTLGFSTRYRYGWQSAWLTQSRYVKEET
jgi:hypothetical protein